MIHSTRYTLTASQHQMWMSQKLHPYSPALHTAHSFELKGKLDHLVFEKSFDELCQQLSVMRFRFGQISEEAYQEIMPDQPAPLVYLDFCNEASRAKEKAIEHFQNRLRSPLDMEQCVYDAVLYKLGQEHHLFYLNIHHLVTDAFSSTVVWKALCDLYLSHLETKSFCSLDLYSYEESLGIFGSTQNVPVKPNPFWKESVQNVNKNLEFYGNKSVSETKAKQLRIRPGEEKMKQLFLLATESSSRSLTTEMSVFQYIICLYATFIYRITGDNNVTIGIPVQNRSSFKAKKSPGLWAELYPLVLQIKGNWNQEELLAYTKEQVFNFFKNSQPGNSTAEVNANNSAIFNFITAQFDQNSPWEVQSDWLHPGDNDPSHLLRCHYFQMDGPDAIPEIWFDFNQGVFPEESWQAATDQFMAIFDSFLKQEDWTLDQIPLAAQKIPEPLSSEAPQDLVEVLLNTFLVNADQEALIQEGLSYTFEELSGAVGSIIDQLKQSECKPGDHIGLYFERSPEYIASLLACLIGGYVFVPLESTLPPNRLKYILQQAQIQYVLCSEATSEKDLGGVNHGIVQPFLFKRAQSLQDLTCPQSMDSPAYILFTSGSTGKPKGVVITRKSLSFYVSWAYQNYLPGDGHFHMPLFTSIGFDLTMTSVLLSLFKGGKLSIYMEPSHGPDSSIIAVAKNKELTTLKMTPSHLKIWLDTKPEVHRLDSVILGGEELHSVLARELTEIKAVRVFNEYGPTEATIGCIVQEYSRNEHLKGAVPVGRSVPYGNYVLLNEKQQIVPAGHKGEIYLYGSHLALGYWNDSEKTAESFINLDIAPYPLYKTGDFGRVNFKGELEYLGRKDSQVKWNGHRIELAEIQNNLQEIQGIENSEVLLWEEAPVESTSQNCVQCGLPSNYPGTDFDQEGKCHLCRSFEGYGEKVKKYFKTEEDLERLLLSKRGPDSSYDCLALLSGGKDSTYVVARLVHMGLRVLTFTLDNGYISEGAKKNIAKVVQLLGVDHLYGSTEHMNAIFVDSLHRHHNVCNGCFKTIYTLSTQIALEKEIPFIVTGLSRGQFFETRLTEELFWNEEVDSQSIDDTILQARKLYHQEDDAVKNCLDVGMFNEASTFEKVEFVDFYRFCDVSLQELLRYLDEEVGWQRPTDTGRSTNCLINQAGIYVHKKTQGYSNYAFPYSWDVRLGHKERDESLEEVNEEIDELESLRILNEIGYPTESLLSPSASLLAFYKTSTTVSEDELKRQLGENLPSYMIPSKWVMVDDFPLTGNGKVNQEKLISMALEQPIKETAFIAPTNQVEELVSEIWSGVLLKEPISTVQNFVDLGGHSLAAIRVTARLNENLGLDLPLNWVFEFPTIKSYAAVLEKHLEDLLSKQNDH